MSSALSAPGRDDGRKDERNNVDPRASETATDGQCGAIMRSDPCCDGGTAETTRQPVALDDDPRIPVWCALSDLYLDTDVAMSYAGIAETLADSPYSLDALREMLIDEVHPALYPNLMQVAGAWAGFDRTWLLERIAQVRRQPRWRRRLSRLFVRSVRDDWRRVACLVAQRRAACGRDERADA